MIKKLFTRKPNCYMDGQIFNIRNRELNNCDSCIFKKDCLSQRIWKEVKTEDIGSKLVYDRYSGCERIYIRAVHQECILSRATRVIKRNSWL